MPSRILRLVVDAQHGDAGELAAIDARGRRAAAPAPAPRSTAAPRPRSASRARPPSAARPCGRARARCAPRSTGRARARAPPWRLRRAGGIRGRSRASSTPECRARCRRRRCAACRARRRQPTSTRPFGVYLIALETRFCSSRRSSRRSERTLSEQGTKVSSRPFSRASGANSTSSWRSSSSMRKLTSSGLIAPVSSREMSSSAPKISSTASSEASTLATRRPSSPLPCRSTSEVT